MLLPKTSWIGCLKKHLSHNGLGDLWTSVSNFNVSSIDVSQFSQRLENIYQQDWHAGLHNDVRRNHSQKNKLRLYRQFKQTFGFEKYLSMSLPVLDRIHLTKFRISNHKLLIEYGRYRGIPVNARLCNHCHKVEDEVHFLLECKHHKTFRFDNVNPQLPKEVIFLKLMSSSNGQVILSLSSFVSKAFKARDIDVKFLPRYF